MENKRRTLTSRAKALRNVEVYQVVVSLSIRSFLCVVDVSCDRKYVLLVKESRSRD